MIEEKSNNLANVLRLIINLRSGYGQCCQIVRVKMADWQAAPNIFESKTYSIGSVIYTKISAVCGWEGGESVSHVIRLYCNCTIVVLWLLVLVALWLKKVW